MEGTESTTRQRTTGKDGTQAADQTLLMSDKPLHRFVQREPRSLGIVLLIFGCAELLMGFLLAQEIVNTSCRIYIPFWQGALFLVCGILSIYTGMHPSKRMVTVSLAMYVVSILGIVVSAGYRIYLFFDYIYIWYRSRHSDDGADERVNLLYGIEGILFIWSLFVSGLLIFLCCVTRLALKSTQTQIIVQHIQSPPSDTTDQSQPSEVLLYNN